MEPTSRRGFLAATGVAGTGVLTGCIGDLTSTSTGDSEGDEKRQPTTATGRTENGVPLAESQLPVEYELESLQNDVLSGGPPKDGIPSIDDPQFRSAREADDELRDADVVFGLVRNGAVKAYPQRILVHHEITNDVAGDEPVAITYCPLTGTAMGFRRGETTFGVSGKLLNNNLVMYDRASDSRWPQILGTAISGPFQGESLQEFRLLWTTWNRWKEVHPDTMVLSTDTGYVRNYGVNGDPYGSYAPNRAGYYSYNSTMFPQLKDDDTFPAKHVVMGTRTDAGRIAFDKEVLRADGLRSGTVGGTPHVAVYEPALDTGYIYRNPDDASFTHEDGQVVAEDGTTHDPSTLPLDRVYAFDAMWFAWVGFYPSTGVVA